MSNFITETKITFNDKQPIYFWAFLVRGRGNPRDGWDGGGGGGEEPDSGRERRLGHVEGAGLGGGGRPSKGRSSWGPRPTNNWGPGPSLCQPLLIVSFYPKGRPLETREKGFHCPTRHHPKMLSQVYLQDLWTISVLPALAQMSPVSVNSWHSFSHWELKWPKTKSLDEVMINQWIKK